MPDITPFDLAGSLAKRNVLIQQQREMDTQNAFAQALPMLQTDPQNALATVGKTGNLDAYAKLSTIISQSDDRKKAQIADRTAALAKVGLAVQQYKDPVIRKAVAMSMLPELAPHGVTADTVQNGDWSDNGINTLTNMSRSVNEIIAQNNSDRTYQAGRSDHADTLKQQDRQYNLQAGNAAESHRHNLAMEAENGGGGDTGGGLDDAAKVNAAVRYNATGVLPPLGSGKAAHADRKEILNYAAKISAGVKPEQLVANIANFKALSGSLNTQTKQFNAIETAANAAKNSANLALEAARKGGAGPTSVPAFNKWIQAGRKATGDLNVKNLANHLDTFAEEYAKVMTGATGASPATDSARQAAKERINAAYDVAGLESIISEMSREMGGRHYAARAQLQSITDQLSGKAYSEPQGVETKPAAVAPGNIPPPPPGFVVHQ